MTVYVKNYVTLPCPDACEGVRAAIAAAIDTNADELVFEAGVYNLRTPIEYKTDIAGHDAGAARSDTKEVLALVTGAKGLRIVGATDELGEPATVFAGINDLAPHSLLPSILGCDRCENLTVENLAFTRVPEFASTGKVESIGGSTLVVSVAEGLTCYDNMPTHCMNRFTPDGERLVGESLSYGPGLGVNWKLVGERKLALDCEKVASRVEVGDMLSWHQGSKTDFQCYFGRVRGLTLRNLRTYNANGFAMLAFDCTDIFADRVVFKPREGLLFTAPRDAWKLHKCSGKVEISRMYVEGVRMDGQNVHNNYMFVREAIDEHTLKLEIENALCEYPIGSELEFFEDEKPLGSARLAAYELLSAHSENGRNFNLYRFELEKSLDFEVSGKTLVLAHCFDPEYYHCRDSEFKNIAGAGHLLRISHVLIENCRYENTMNAGVMLGAEFPTHHEGGHAIDVTVRGCEFKNCGFYPRYGTIGCIGVNSSGFKSAVNRDILIEGCRFADSEVGVDLHCARDVRVKNCRYENVSEDVRLN